MTDKTKPLSEKQIRFYQESIDLEIELYSKAYDTAMNSKLQIEERISAMDYLMSDKRKHPVGPSQDSTDE